MEIPKKKNELVSKNNKINDEIIKLSNQLKNLKKELKEHSNCQILKEKLNFEIISSKEELLNLKNKNTEINNKIKELQIKIENSKKAQETLKENNEKLKQKQKTNINNISNESKIDFNEINSPFTENELQAIFNVFNQNKNQLAIFLRKMEISENYLNSLESRHKFDVKNQLNKINDLDERIEYMNVKNGQSFAKNKIYQVQITEYEKDKKSYENKLNDLNEKINYLQKEIENKEKNVKKLTIQLSNLRNMIKT